MTAISLFFSMIHNMFHAEKHLVFTESTQLHTHKNCGYIQPINPKKQIVLQTASYGRPAIIRQSLDRHPKLEYCPLATVLYLPSKDYIVIENVFLKIICAKQQFVNKNQSVSKENSDYFILSVSRESTESVLHTQVMSDWQSDLFLVELENCPKQGLGLSHSAVKKIEEIVAYVNFIKIKK